MTSSVRDIAALNFPLEILLGLPIRNRTSTSYSTFLILGNGKAKSLNRKIATYQATISQLFKSKSSVKTLTKWQH